MDAEAIKRIEQLVTAGQSVGGVSYPHLVVPAGSQLEGLERFEEEPYRMRARFATERIPDFVRYVSEQSVEGQTAVFVHPRGHGAEAVIDYGTQEEPQWGTHRALLYMESTAEHQALANFTQHPVSQRGATDWIEDWAPYLTPYRGDEDMSIAQAISQLRRIDVKATASQMHEEGDWSGKRSSMEEVEAKSGSGKLPEGLRMRLKLYPSTEERDALIRLQLITGDDKPRIRFRVIGYEALMEDVAREIEETVSNQLSDCRVFVGTLEK
ncbi:MAG: DUF2303 family protein [Myxococcota bacterium]